jgi:hypothetical protein
MMADDNQSTSDQHWHLDRRVPLAMLGGILLQTAVALWWASGLNTRVAQLEQQVTMISPASAVQGGQIIRIQTQLEAITANILEIRNGLQRGQTWVAPTRP